MATDLYYDADIESTVDRFRKENSDLAFKRAQSETKRLKELIELQGLEPPEEAGPSLISRGLDILTTPAQWSTGIAAKLFGVQGYADKGFIDAASKGARTDISAGDIIRKKGLLKNDPILRGIATFAGDVALDPLTYLTLGGSLGAKVGGKVLATETLLGIGKTPYELYLNKLQKLEKTKLGALKKQLADGVLDEKEFNFLSAKSGIEAADEAAQPFKVARGLLEKRKKSTLGKDLKQADLLNDVEASDAFLENQIKEAFDLDPSTPLDVQDLFAKGAIRGTGLLPGVGNGFANIPFVNSRQFDIPGVTAVSEKVFDYLGGKLYNAKVNVGKGLDAIVKRGLRTEDGEKARGAFAFGASLLDSMRKLPPLLSKRIAVGGRHAFETLDEHAVAKIKLADGVRQHSDIIFGDFHKLGGTDEHLEQIGRLYERGENGVKAYISSLDQQKPGLGREALRIFEKVGADFDVLAQRETAAGLLEKANSDYLFHTYKAKDGFDKAQAVDKYLSSLTQKDQPGFSLKRQFETLDKAVLHNLKPEYNLKKIWEMRQLNSRMAFAEKEFLERAGYEFGLPKNLYDKMKAALADKNDFTRKTALAFLKERGVPLKDAVQSSLLPGFEQSLKSKNIPVFKLEGQLLDGESYKNLKELALLPDDNAYGKTAKEVAKRMGLEFTAQEQASVDQISGLFKEYRKGLLGRDGEDIFSRAGVTLAPEKFRNYVAKNAKMDDDDKNFFLGVLPETFVTGIKESLDTRGTLKRMADNLKNSGNPQTAESLERLVGSYLGWTKNLKLGATVMWPAFHLRNLVSAQFQGVQAASALGEQFNPIRLLETEGVKRFGKNVITHDGRVIPNKQIIAELGQMGFRQDNPLAVAEILNHQADYLSAIAGKAPKDPKLTRGFAARAWDTTKQKGLDFTSYIENFGREHLYIQLRRSGFDPASAANEVNKTMINYSRGKTPFERDLLNNVFFFYSFTRGNTSNMITNLVTRPGQLTAQLHGVDAITEMLRDPNALPLPEGAEEKMKSLRGQETLSRFIGRSDVGDPIFAQGFGMPLEDVSKMINISVPEKLTFNSVMAAADKSLRRTSMTTVASMNPLLRAPMEYIADRNLFFDKPLDSEAMRRVPSLEADLPKITQYEFNKIPEAVFKGLNAVTQTALGAKSNGDGTYTANPFALLILTSTIPGMSRALSTIKAAKSPGLTTEQKWTRVLTGVKPTEIDVEKSEVFAERDRLRQFLIDESLVTSKRKLAHQQALKRITGEE